MHAHTGRQETESMGNGRVLNELAAHYSNITVADRL